MSSLHVGTVLKLEFEGLHPDTKMYLNFKLKIYRPKYVINYVYIYIWLCVSQMGKKVQLIPEQYISLHCRKNSK